MFKKSGKATSAIMAGLLAVGMAASPLAPAVAFAANSASTGAQTGSGQTDLTMILKDTDEHGGTAEPEKNQDGTDNPLYNPDADGDGLGDNLAFTVPSAINYVVDADGTMTGPTNASIQNRSVMGINVSSVDVDEETPFTIVSDATASSVDNSVDLQFGPAADQLNAADYLTKTDVADASKWEMGAEGAADANLGIETDGHVSHVATDITQQSKFGTIKWYLKATHQSTENETKSNMLTIDYDHLRYLIGSSGNIEDLNRIEVVKASPDTVNPNNRTIVSDAAGDFPVYFTFDDATGTGRFISEADKIVLPADCDDFFASAYNLVSFDASGFDTSAVTKMNGMFSGCESLAVDFSGWDVSNVTGHDGFGANWDSSTGTYVDIPTIIQPHWSN